MGTSALPCCPLDITRLLDSGAHSCFQWPTQDQMSQHSSMVGERACKFPPLAEGSWWLPWEGKPFFSPLLFKKNVFYVYVCMSVMPAFISVYHVSTWCTQRPEEGTEWNYRWVWTSTCVLFPGNWTLIGTHCFILSLYALTFSVEVRIYSV